MPPRYRHCHSRLATRCTRFPLSSKISTGTQPKTKTSQEKLKAAIFRVLGRCSGPVVGSQASIEGTTSLSSAELARRLGVANMLVTGTRADTCGTKYHHRGRGGGMDTACKDTPIRSSVVTYLPPHCTRKDITTTGGV